MTSRRSGFTLVELMMAIGVLVIALLGLITTILHTTRVNALDRENLAVMRAAEKMVETMRGTVFEVIFRNYNSPPEDDPLGSGTAPGSNFDVEGLKPVPTDPDGRCGKIVFPTDPTGLQLREDVVDPDLAMPRSLNADTDTTDDAATDYRLLPVTIMIEWQSLGGPRRVVYRHLFFGNP